VETNYIAVVLEDLFMLAEKSKLSTIVNFLAQRALRWVEILN